VALDTNRQKRLWGLVLVLGVLGVVWLLERSRTEGAPPVPRAPAKSSTPPVAGPQVAEEPLVDIPATSSPERSTVKWVYDKSLLILLSKQGVGAVAFTESIEKGIVYSFRFESRDGRTKRTGTGKVFERYNVKSTREDGTQEVENDGGQLIINAGWLQAEWSVFSSHAGWVYGNAGNTEVGLVPLEPLDKLDLRKAARVAVRQLPEQPTDDARPVPELGSASANWVYAESLLVLVSEQGVAAVAFTEAIDDGLVYSFRFESRDGNTKEAGSGKAFERYRMKASKDGTEERVNDGGRLFIQAGPLRVGWSLGSRSNGWVYYTPSDTDAQFVPVEPLGTIDLRDFVR
jgi:hypothetical protein